MQEEDLHLKLAKCAFDQDRGGVLRIGGQGWRGMHGPHQTQGRRTVGTAHVSKSSQVLHQIL